MLSSILSLGASNDLHQRMVTHRVPSPSYRQQFRVELLYCGKIILVNETENEVFESKRSFSREYTFLNFESLTS